MKDSLKEEIREGYENVFSEYGFTISKVAVEISGLSAFNDIDNLIESMSEDDKSRYLSSYTLMKLIVETCQEQLQRNLSEDDMDYFNKMLFKAKNLIIILTTYLAEL